MRSVMHRGNQMNKKKQKTSRLWPLGISQQIADLLLNSEGYEESLKVPKVRLAWHLLCFSSIGFVLVILILASLRNYFVVSEILTLYYRIFSLLGFTWLLILINILAYFHYNFLILTGKDLRFSNIAFFYILAVIFYGFIYKDIYLLNHNLVSYINPIHVPKSVITVLSFFDSLIIRLDFLVYSACTSLSLTYYKISSSSLIVAIINIVQVISTLLIIALLVATFVQKKTMPNIDVE